jgi:ankyrin repeat protein
MKSLRRAEAQASAFHAATKDGNLALVEFLLEDGIGVDVKNADGRTALSIAAEQGSDPIVRKLLEHGADPALKSAKISDSWTNKFRGERTPLHWAAYNGHVGCTKLLLDHGADPDSRNYSRRTPIQEATMRRCKSVVQVLLDHGADVSPRDNVGWTPLHETAFLQILHIAELLLDRGADIGAITTEDEESVLHLAAREGKRESVAFFLRKGANPKLKTRFGKTAAQLALESGNEEIALLIGGYGTSS